MKILMVNKFLFPHGGSETYIFDVGKQLSQMGHEVQYFGMDAKERIVGNRVNSYTASMDFHTNGLQKLLYPFKIIYSMEARKKIRLVLDDFAPDIVHLNNINFQLTPSIIHEIDYWRKKKKKKVKIVYTAHDAQWVCPNHLMMVPSTKERCLKCKDGRYRECIRQRCIHNSKVKSILAAIEAWLFKKMKIYEKVDTVICPSRFMKSVLSNNPAIKEKLIVLHNYCAIESEKAYAKKDYILYFGRYSEEKGISLLAEVCKELSHIPFIVAGDGPLKELLESLNNVKNMGFLKGKELESAIGEARMVIVPSIWYENCPFTVIEAQRLGTPVIASNLGGIPELIDQGKTGEVFEPGNLKKLEDLIRELWTNVGKTDSYSRNCKQKEFDSLSEYCKKLLEIYTVM